MSHTTKSTVQCHLDSKKHQVAVETMQGPQRGVEHKEIAGALLSSLATAQIHPDRINFVISDEGSTVVAAAKHVLQHVWQQCVEESLREGG